MLVPSPAAPTRCRAASGEALVWAPADRPLNLKLLYGSSYKAPSAEQLYTQPIRDFDIRGNDQLRAQTAQTGEVAGAYRFTDHGELMVNLDLADKLSVVFAPSLLKNAAVILENISGQ